MATLDNLAAALADLKNVIEGGQLILMTISDWMASMRDRSVSLF